MDHRIIISEEYRNVVEIKKVNERNNDCSVYGEEEHLDLCMHVKIKLTMVAGETYMYSIH